MSKDQLQDYEPLRRTSSKTSSALNVGLDEWPRQQRAGVSALPNTAVETLPAPAKAESKKSDVVEAAEPPDGSASERFSPERGHGITFIGVLLFTVLVYFRPYELISALEWTSSLAFYLALCTIIVFLPTQLGLEGRLTCRTREVNMLLLLLLGCLLSITFAIDRLRTWNSFTEFLKVAVIFVVMVNVLRTELRLKVVIWIVLAASCIASVSALHDYTVGNLTLQGRRIEGIIGGLLSNPNDLALHLVTMVPLAFGLAMSRKNLLIRLVYLAMVPLIIAGIVATFSRGGFLALVCVAFYVFYNLAKRNRLLVVLALVIMLLAALAIFPSAYRSRIADAGDASASTRMDDLKRSIFLTVRHPVFGIGMGNYVLYSNSSKVAHNGYTHVGAELGIAAMIVYIVFLVSPIRKLRRQRKELDNRAFRWMALGLEGSLVGYMVASFFASVSYLWYAYYLVAFAVCLRRIIATASSNATMNSEKSSSLSPQRI